MSSFGAMPGDTAHMATDANFDSFIDSDLILEPNSFTTQPNTPKSPAKREAKGKPVPLSALPSRISMSAMDRHTPSSPGAAAGDFLQYSNSSGSSVTTPTTSNSSSLHNLNFDFYDAGGDGAASTAPVPSDGMSPDEDMTNVSTPSASAFSTSTPASIATPSVHGMGPMMNAPFTFYTHPMAAMNQPSYRTVDDMGHQPGHQQVGHHHAHHQRSLSLLDVGAPPQIVGMPNYGPHPSFMPFRPVVKMEMDAVNNGSFGMMNHHPIQGQREAEHYGPNAPNVASNSDKTSPPKEKKRKLTNQKAQKDGEAAPKAPKAAPAKKSTNAQRRNRANIASSKEAGEKAPSEAQRAGSVAMLANSLIENVATPNSATPQPVAMPAADDSTTPNEQDNSHTQSDESDDDMSISDTKPAKSGTKRPPPSASQITESGMPFPVIDTSAKHSSLFVPPDTSGLTKREARLVKNRAAAFLSRQRKREQFEELEIKCRSLCRLVWKMWELGSGTGVAGGPSKVAALFADQGRVSGVIVKEEGDEVQEVFDTVLALKGGSVAPTEDGQLQGAVAAGIKSANGKIIGDATSVVHFPSSAAKAAEEASKELTKLRLELDESRRREAALHADLAQERAARLKSEFEANQRQQEQRPFRGGSTHDLSLTVPATFDEEEEEEEEERRAGSPSKSDGGDSASNDADKKGQATRAAGNLRPSRTSQRLQRQGQPSPGAVAPAASAGGQRKAAGAALMMVLFSFALFGLPGGQMGRVGGITRAPGSSDDFPLGRVLGAPIAGTNFNGGAGEDEDDSLDNEGSGHLPPSSHLSVNDLFPPAHEMQDLLNAAAAVAGEGDEGGARQTNIPHTLHDVFGGNHAGESSDFSIDYKAFAKDLGSSLEWDMQGGFLVLGSEGDHGKKTEKREGDVEFKDEQQTDKADMKDAPTKLTLFVPAPDMSNSPDTDAVEDHFYDAPLAAAEADGLQYPHDGNSPFRSDMTQVEATRAALQVLRNHRVAREAANAASRRFGKQPSPSQRANSPASPLVNGKTAQVLLGQSYKKATAPINGKADAAHRVAVDEQNRQTELGSDVGSDVLDASGSATDRIRGTDFYQLEFSLSGAKVRNVAELARLLGNMRSKAD